MQPCLTVTLWQGSSSRHMICLLGPFSLLSARRFAQGLLLALKHLNSTGFSSVGEKQQSHCKQRPSELL
ncbi:unnamed protein product [Heterosigma akashiwo]